MQVFGFLWAPAVLLLLISCDAEPSRLESHNIQRGEFILNEQNEAFGANVTFSLEEFSFDQTIMKAKTEEYPKAFLPLSEILAKINESKLFKYISEMPKGAVLHAHDRALCSIDCIMKLTYLPNATICQSTTDEKVVKLIFSTEVRAHHNNGTEYCVPLAIQRGNESKSVDESLRQQLSLDPMDNSLDRQNVLNKFEKINSIVDSLLLYAPAWKEYFNNSLGQFLADGVQYFEFRSALPIMYDLNGTYFSEVDYVRICKEILDEFMKNNTDFIGCKVIYAPYRAANQSQLEQFKKTFLDIKTKYPDFVAGFDVSHNLKDFKRELLDMADGKDLFLHANATDLSGASIDEILLDAVLLNTKRIDNAFVLIKHPLVMKYVKNNDTAVEILPLSNQLLGFVSDNRNHPCSHLFADNYPVVVSSEYPSIWNLKPLSHDFYMAFLAIGPFRSDLKLLKQLAKNSINYSSLSETQKADAVKKWESKWEKFIFSLPLSDDVKYLISYWENLIALSEFY